MLPFLLALVLAVPLAHGAAPVPVGETTTSSAAAVASATPALAPSPVLSLPAAPAPVTDPVAANSSTAPVVGPVSPAPVLGPVAGPVAPAAAVSGVTDAAAATAPAASPTALPDATATTAATVRRSTWKTGGSRLVVPVTAPGTTAAVRNSKPTAQATPEAVLNPAAAVGTSGWQAGSAAGPISISRATGITGPFAGTTALQFERAAGTGDWSLALGALSDPAGFFTVGTTYTMSAWVRDLNASGKSVGLLIADNHYGGRPSDMTVYEGHSDTGWHLLSRSFVATSPASAAAGVYLALPQNGAMLIQVTGVSVREAAAAPTQQVAAPTRKIAFGGAAGAPVDGGLWNAETGGGGWGNGELETYTDRPSNAHLDGNGNLVITARREDYAASDGIQRHYTSARLTTEGKFVVQPGSYVEADITAPVGPSVWPAFWLIGSNVRTVGWPACGELDVLEGAGAQPNLAFNAAHMARIDNPQADSQYGWSGSGTTDLGQSLDSGSHRYGVYFDGSSVRFFVDRRLVRTLSAADATASGRSWPFGKAQYIVLNVAVAGDAGDPTATTFPRTMTVGGISVWEGGVPF